MQDESIEVSSLRDFPPLRDADPGKIDEILLALGGQCAVDFEAYRRPTFVRAVARCMRLAGVDDLEAYGVRLRCDPRELERLCREFPVHKTGFFRDDIVWSHLADSLIPTLVHRHGRPVRAWSAGCASGEEAYSLAMLLAEAHGIDGLPTCTTPRSPADHFELMAARPFVVFATDLSPTVVARASRGVYTAEAAATIPEPLRQRYLVADGRDFVVRPELRACVVFSRHDVLRQPPLCHIDLLTCRNVFMYFERNARAAALARLRFAIRRGGVLVVGRSERSLLRSDGFTPLSLEYGTYVACDPR